MWRDISVAYLAYLVCNVFPLFAMAIRFVNTSLCGTSAPPIGQKAQGWDEALNKNSLHCTCQENIYLVTFPNWKKKTKKKTAESKFKSLIVTMWNYETSSEKLSVSTVLTRQTARLILRMRGRSSNHCLLSFHWNFHFILRHLVPLLFYFLHHS